MNNEDLTKLLIDAIVGRGFLSTQHAIVMTDRGLAKFTGNQWNEDWGWRKDKLREIPVDALQDLYDAKEEDFPEPPVDDSFLKVSVKEGAIRDQILAEVVYADPAVHAAAAVGVEAAQRVDSLVRSKAMADVQAEVDDEFLRLVDDEFLRLVDAYAKGAS